MPDYELRSLQVEDDLAAITMLRNQYYKANGIDRRVSEDYIKQLFTYPDHQPEKDNAVLVQDGNIVAHIWLWQQTSARTIFDLVIHPDHPQDELGATLLQWAIERAREQGSDFVDAQRSYDDIEGIRFLRDNGFKPLGTYLGMELAPTVKLPDNSLPDGYLIKPYSEVKDLAMYAHIMNQSYGDLWGHMQGVSEEFMQKSFEEYKPDDVFLVFDAVGTIAGVGRIAYDHARTVYMVDAPGIVPAHRSPELYGAVLVYCLRRLRAIMQKSTHISLHSWGDFDSSVANFWRLGFENKRHVIGYRYYL